MILFFGPAGAGKSVQGQMLGDKKDWQWISTGQLFRESKDPKIQQILASGQLVSSEQTQELLASQLETTRGKQIILDGFPRKLEQVEWLVDNQKSYEYTIDLAIIIDISKEEILKRLQIRGRAEDDPEVIEKRLAIYYQEIDPLISYLADHKVPIAHVNGVGDMDEINQNIMQAVATNVVT
jgi:adenylate kinase